MDSGSDKNSLSDTNATALVVMRSVRDGTNTIDTAAWIVVLAVAFAVVSILALEQVLPNLERALF